MITCHVMRFLYEKHYYQINVFSKTKLVIILFYIFIKIVGVISDNKSNTIEIMEINKLIMIFQSLFQSRLCRHTGEWQNSCHWL